MFKFDKPEIFPKNKIVSGFTHKNIDIHQSLNRGLHFKFKEQKEYLLSKQILANELKISVKQIKIANQNHTDKVGIADENLDAEHLEVDALITNKPGVLLGAKSADCCIILLYDPVQKVIASIHSGRRGTEKQITSKTLLKMQTEFSCKPENILAYLSPSASFDVYTVYESIAKSWPAEFKQKLEIDHSSGEACEPSPFIIQITRNYEPSPIVLPITPTYEASSDIEKDAIQHYLQTQISSYKEEPLYLIDIKGWIKQQLLDSGLLENNIEISDKCSILDSNYHSIRFNRENYGVALGFIMLK